MAQKKKKKGGQLWAMKSSNFTECRLHIIFDVVLITVFYYTY